MKIIHVVGARPNFMKIAPIIERINVHNQNCRGSSKQIDQILVHTGQHYDEQMSKLFFDDLEIPKPNINLEVGSSFHAEQTAEIMKRFEPVLNLEKPDIVVVVGDVNSTIACSLVASKIEYPATQSVTQRSRPLVAHVEAGLRSFDRSMPEEINRVLTDAIADLLFTTEESANENLRREGIPEEKIHFVGNVMIDTLLKHKKKAEQSDVLTRLGLTISQPSNSIDLISSINSKAPYAVLTLHRPSNVDDEQTFRSVLEALTVIAREIQIIFPVHPRTLNRIREFNFEKYFGGFSINNSKLETHNSGVHCIDPLGYLDFLHLMANSNLVITDSGGIQEETTVLGIPCVTLRENTERPVTVTHGTNVVVGKNRENIIEASLPHLSKPFEPNRPYKLEIPPLWDGKAAERIVTILVRLKVKQ